MWSVISRNLKGTTSYTLWRRRHGKRSLVRTTLSFPHLRGKRKAVPVDPARQFFWLAVPGVAVAAVGSFGLLWPRASGAGMEFFLLISLSGLLALRAYTARASVAVRAVAVVASLIYPVLYFLARNGWLG